MIMIDKTDRSTLYSAIMCALLLVVIFYSLYVRVQMYTLGISLWTDEARLAESIVDRTMREMLTPPLANMQTAPVLYLVVVKLLTILFGTSEAVLRVFSFICMIGMLIAQGVIIRKIFRVTMVYTLFSVALSSTLGYYVYYSNELKPYMGDALFVLLVFLGYYAYRKGLLGKGIQSALILGGVFSVCLLFSTPAVFAAAAVAFVELLSCLRNKNRTAVLNIIIAGAVFMAVFVINYYLWLRPIATYEGMVEYWADRKFDFLMTDLAAIRHNISMIRDVLEPVRNIIWIAAPFAAFGFVISIVKRNIYTAAFGVFFVILLVASAIDKYPIYTRLWMFLYAIIFIYVFVFIDSIRMAVKDGIAVKAVKTVVPLSFAFIILMSNISYLSDYGRGEDWTHWSGNHANPLIAYVEENIREGETLYSWHTANLIVKYKIGYHTNRIGNANEDNIIFGTTDFRNDIEKIMDAGGTYLLFYHDNYVKTRTLIEGLKKRGFLELIMDENDTYLYWFTTDKTRIRMAAALDTDGLDTGGGRVYGELGVTNTGAAIIAPDKPLEYIPPSADFNLENYERVFIVLHSPNERLTVKDAMFEIILGEIEAPVRPGERIDVIIDYSGLEPGEYLIDLVAYGKYLFSEIGSGPVKFTVRK